MARRDKQLRTDADGCNSQNEALTKIIFDLKEPAYLLNSMQGHQTILGDIVACL